MKIDYICPICQSEVDTLYNFEGKQVCEYCLTIIAKCIVTCDNCHRPINEAFYEYKGDVFCRNCLLRMAKSEDAFITNSDCMPIPEIEETYMDDIGGIHSPCDCYNPYGHFCGDCGKLSCKECKYRDLQPDEE